MTELERILIDRLERMEAAHQRQTAALEQRLQQQALSLNELQTACTSALVSCGTLCRGRFRKRNLKYVKALVAVVAL